MSWIKLTDRWKAWTWGRDSDTKFSQAENILILDSFLKIISVRIILYQRTKGKSYFSWPFKLISVLLDLLPTKKVLKAACDAFLCLLSPHPGRGLLLGLVHWGRSPWPARVSPSVPAWLPFFQEPSLASAWVRRSVLPRQVPGLLGLLLRPQLSVGWINELGTEYYRVLFFLSVSLTRKRCENLSGTCWTLAEWSFEPCVHSFGWRLSFRAHIGIPFEKSAEGLRTCGILEE